MKIQLPDFSDHPPPPVLTNENYAAWILNEWLPICVERGELTEESRINSFMNNEGRMEEFKI